MTDPAVEAAQQACEGYWNGNDPYSEHSGDDVLAAAREALAPIREWWESGNGTNYDALLPLIYADKELSDD